MLPSFRFTSHGRAGARPRNGVAAIRYFDAPIVPVRLHGYNHYVVFKGMTPGGEVRIADPAYGNRTLSREKFEAAWIDGIAFVMLENAQ
jgi:ABC-type bacteriocin/lantibiotic exporter with double-glycine peptidase domain